MERDEAYESILTQKHNQALCAIHSLFEGDKEAAHVWMMLPNNALEGETPISLLWSHCGCDMVVRLVHKLENGVVV